MELLIVNAVERVCWKSNTLIPTVMKVCSQQLLKIESFCLKRDDKGSLHLDHSHSYYYQVQTQLFACSVQYCDFCVYTFVTTKEGDSPPYIEHIVRDNEFWKACIMKAKQFLPFACYHRYWGTGTHDLLLHLQMFIAALKMLFQVARNNRCTVIVMVQKKAL